MPLLDGGGRPDSGAGTDQGLPDLGQKAPVPALLATAAQPILDGPTSNGAALAYHDGKSQYVVATSPGVAALRLTQNLDNTGAVVSNNAAITLHDYMGGVDSLSAWTPGDASAYELEDRALPDRDAVAASTDSAIIAWVHVDADGLSGDVVMRKRTGSQRDQVSPTDLHGVDLLSCATQLVFYDPQHLLALACPVNKPTQLTVVDATSTTGAVVHLSDPAQEDVDQFLMVPGGRILWVNKLSSNKDPGALKSATVDGTVRQVLETMVPVKTMAQLTLSEDGVHAYYLTGTGSLRKVHTRGEEPGVTLTTDRVDRIVSISPDGSTAAVARGTAPMERLSLIDTTTKGSVDPPLGTGMSQFPGDLFTRDSQLALYLTDGGVLSAFPAHGPTGTPRVVVRTNVQAFAPITGTKVLALHDTAMGQAVASVLDAKGPMQVVDKDRGLNPSRGGAWTLTPDRGKLLYVKGAGVWVVGLP